VDSIAPDKVTPDRPLFMNSTFLSAGDVPMVSKLRVAACFLLGIVSPFTLANDVLPISTGFSVDTILALQTPQDIQISPEGSWVAYVVSRNDEKKDKGFTQVWMTSVDGKVSIPMTAAYANASSPRWNPDGTTLAFLGERGDGGAARESEKPKAQVWILDRRGGEAQQFTNIKQGVEGFAWSPDGTRMLLTIRDPDPKDLKDEEAEKKGEVIKPEPWVIDRLQFKQDYVGYLNRLRTHFYLYSGEGDPIQITSGDYDDSDPQWSPGGDRIAFVSKRDGDPDGNDNSDIWTVSTDADAESYPLVQVTTNKGSDKSPTWSPDGKTIGYTTVTEPEKLWYATEKLAVIDAGGGGTAKILTADYDRMVFNPEFSPNGKSIYFTADDGGNSPLVKAAVSNGKLSVVTPVDKAVREFALHKNGVIATVQSDHDTPYEVHVIKKGSSNQLSRLNDKLLEGVKLARVERLKVAGYNNDMVESFVYYPHDHKAGSAYPTIFVLHGGPVGQHDAAFDIWGQFYAANGYIAVLPNPHGSSGYGEAFTYTLNRQWGVSDFADVDAIADHLVDNGISDGDKLGVGGWSYGGILTNYVITKSTRFKGAVSGASEVNHRANYGHDIYQHFWEVEIGVPWEDIDAWESMNPFNDLGKVTTPTLVIGGKEDWNVPIQNSEQLYQVLKRRGIETQLVVYPDEFHGIKRPSFVRDRYNRYLDWYEKYVK
jgi:dipeptidyl aminopeptidase/acylaminoacyl peptidase